MTILYILKDFIQIMKFWDLN